MTRNERIDSLRGRTVRWTFTDGPAAGVTYEHMFETDGSISFRAADAAQSGGFTRARDGTVARIDDGTFVVSYLSESGFTLTVVLNTRDHTMIGFASNNESWFQQQGTFEVVT